MESERGQFIALIHAIRRRGWSPATGGNFSLVLSRNPLRLLITPSGIDKGDIAARDLLEIDREGRCIGANGQPSAEALLHIPIVEERKATCVLHVHTVWNTLASLRGKSIDIEGLEMLKALSGLSSHLDHERIPILPNSQDMPALSAELRSVLRTYPNCHGVLLAGHGLYTWGDSPSDAYRHLEALEFLLEVFVRRST